MNTGRQGLLGSVSQWAKDVAGDWDADRALMMSMAAVIELAKRRAVSDGGAQYEAGSPLRLLLAGYSGTRNTGADVRVEEMIRQFRHLLGDEQLDLSILTIDPARSRGYFPTVKQLHLPKIYPKFLAETVHEQHGVVACEGSMFKSKFANALSTLMVGALGLASAEGKAAIGYGGEAGAMDDALEDLVKRYCQDALILVRNEASGQILGDLGVRSEPGTDTAWTFEAAPKDVGRQVLLDAGWDGQCPVLAVCPINPFWWPVKPDIRKGVAHLLSGAHRSAHYASVYFHASGPEVDALQRTYISHLAEAIRRFQQERKVCVVLVGMEALDRHACDGLNEALGGGLPQFISDDVDMYTMVSVLRQCTMLVSSRYHAIVCSMPAAVPSVGVTMDERIRNLMVDRGQPELSLEVDDPNLSDKLYASLNRLHGESEAVQAGIESCVVQNLERMGRMGMTFVDYLRATYPTLVIADHLGSDGDPWDHLPPLSAHLEGWVARYGSSR